MTPQIGEYTIAELVRSLNRIETKVDGLAANYLPRSEWEVWAKARDREIAKLQASRAPWWTWATVAIAGLSMIITLITTIS